MEHKKVIAKVVRVRFDPTRIELLDENEMDIHTFHPETMGPRPVIGETYEFTVQMGYTLAARLDQYLVEEPRLLPR